MYESLKMALLVCLIIGNLLFCIKNKEWRDSGAPSLLVAFGSFVNPAAVVVCLFVLFVLIVRLI